MANEFEDWLPEEVVDELDIVPEELSVRLRNMVKMADDRSHWDQYDEMPWNG